MMNLTPYDDLVASYISSEGEQNFKRVLFVKYAILIDAMRKAGTEGERAADYLESNLAVLKRLPGDVLVEAGTPFFWMNVARCRSALLRDRAKLPVYSRHLVMLAFDSFFENLPDGTSFTLPDVDGAEIVLPRLRVRVPSEGKSAVLRRVGSERLEVEVGGERLDITVGNVAPEYLMPHLTIPGHESAVILRVKDPALFEDDYIDTLSLINVSAVSLSQKIGRALDMMGEADPELASQIKRHIKWFFPIITNNPTSVHNSFTAQRLIGGMFLSGGYRFMPLLEAIVHEYHHTELYIVMATQQVIGEVKPRLYYSPWRDDARPLLGLFHALHVFSQIDEFYGRAEQSTAFADYKDYIAARRVEICRQLRVGLKQIREDELPQIGRDIYGFMAEQLDRREKELGKRYSRPSPEMITHLTDWCRKHPELVSEVSLPDGFQAPDREIINEQS
jgi:HEXXH motif-containing protein